MTRTILKQLFCPFFTQACPDFITQVKNLMIPTVTREIACVLWQNKTMEKRKRKDSTHKVEKLEGKGESLATA